MSFFHHVCIFFVCLFSLKAFVYVSEFFQVDRMKREEQDAKNRKLLRAIVFESQFFLGRTLRFCQFGAP